LIETGHQPEETTEETTEATTLEDDKTPTAIKETVHKTTFKETPLPLETHQMPASNAEK